MDSNFPRLDVSSKSSDPIWLLSLAVFLPCLSVLAGYYINQHLLLLVYLIAGLTVFVVRIRMRESFSDRFFPVLLASIALSLLMSGALIPNYIPQGDVLGEFILYRQIAQLGFWQSQTSVLYNSALSVTILPSIISQVTSIDGSTVFLVVYPFVFAIVPAVLYKIYRGIMSPVASFISVFFFLSYPSTYFEMLSLGRQMIGELVMVLLLWLLLTPRFRKSRAGAILVVLLTTGLVISHYSLTLIYLGLIGFSYGASAKSRAINSNFFAISFVTAAAWFLLAAGGIVLHTAVGMSTVIASSLTDFFGSASRPSEVYSAVGLTTVNYGVLHLANRGIQYLVILCIVVGFLTYFLKKPDRSGKEAIIPLMAASMFLLIAAVALPFLGSTLTISRIYSISLLFLSPCFYFGASKITSGFSRVCGLLTRNRVRIKTKWLAPAAIIFLYLIFTSGWVWAVTSDTPTSLVLDLRHTANYYPDATVRFEYYSYYVQSQDVAAGGWIRSYSNGGLICADLKSQLTVVVLYGGQTRGPDLDHFQACEQAAYVYVSVTNSVIGLATSQAGTFGLGSASLVGHETFFIVPVNVTIAPLLPHTENRIYSDGGTIYSPHS